ncbi:MAG: glycoside hydrolase family 3 protein [Clostridiales bacterium]|nr:glycoside hydrolase family 3 protein [Clostridiales bacterium]
MDRNLARQRAEALVSQMTVEEKISQLKYIAPAIDRLGVPAYNWWSEALHGVARAGTATIFPQAIGLAAMFDEKFQQEIAETISTEGRAKYNMQSGAGDRGQYKGLTFWSPNVNIFRDPRWGRGQETYGEDPFLAGRLGVAFVKGLQGDGEYMKAAACAKHFAVHSGPEELRHEFDARPSDYDLWDTYLPAFEMLVKEADVEAVMGAYNRTNGEVCCGSKTLIGDILRGKWGFAGHYVSDCGAIWDFHNHHKVTDTPMESAALALREGCDVNCGGAYDYLYQAYAEGLVTADHIHKAAVRLFTARYLLGLFDENCEFNSIGYEYNDCDEHNAQALEAARRSMVLLKNDGILPVDKSKIRSVAVIGPNAASRVALEGNYNGTSSRYVTFLDGIRAACGEGIRINYSSGSRLAQHFEIGEENCRLDEAAAAAKMSDLVVLCVGLDSTYEGEEGDANNPYAAGDKGDLELPFAQRKLIETVLAAGKPVITVVASGSALRVEEGNAVLWAGYPGQAGGKALAEIIFGEVSPSGKLPITFYKSVDQIPAFEDYTMQNRTYRYFKGEALYPFGFGLSYTKFEYSDLAFDAENLLLTVKVRNVGSMAAGEIVQAYIRDLEAESHGLNWKLCAFDRITLAAGEEKCVALKLSADAFTTVTDDGSREKIGSNFRFWVGGSQPDTVSCKLLGTAPLSMTVEY